MQRKYLINLHVISFDSNRRLIWANVTDGLICLNAGGSDFNLCSGVNVSSGGGGGDGCGNNDSDGKCVFVLITNTHAEADMSS